MFFKKKIEIKPVRELKHESVISIYVDPDKFKSEYFRYECTGIKSHNEKLKPWVGFIKWYHCRKQSESYTIRFKNGQTTILRKYITGYNITSYDYFK